MIRTVYTRSLLPLFRGIGQVMFQENALSGLLMWLGLCFASPEMAVMSLLGGGVSTLAAVLLRYPEEEIRAGLYGFNGTLVGIAVVVLLHFTPLALLLAVLFSVFSTWLAHAWTHRWKWQLSPFTAPFILATWLMLLVCHLLLPGLLAAPSVTPYEPDVEWLQAFCMEVGQVMFSGSSIWSGIFFFLGIAVGSRRHAFYALLGVLLPVLLLFTLEENHALMNEGMWGYNAVLAAISLSGNGWKPFGKACLGVLLSVLLQEVGLRLGIPTLTAPFVLAVWMVQAACGQFRRA